MRQARLSMANCYIAKPHGIQHCYIPFLYVIDFKGALDFGEAQLPEETGSNSYAEPKEYGACPRPNQECTEPKVAKFVFGCRLPLSLCPT